MIMAQLLEHGLMVQNVCCRRDEILAVVAATLLFVMIAVTI